ncbi:undecaprenyl-phosphate glucose phosphotransferase [Pedobacter sp. HMF7647]|uniref:Undecaprenyl-phosphate glucose phosphotransferase n=1 Tax=Hufsiella arboris TaxID=2695275 RepID=A0A7K1Y712_9SPHI|nr:undecaprenyl-phosphate glucose phosphotransferase [Hufsiella arboris]MXV50201.1 undecaprenyl-phosphate glucose phosphotransferase [Hufsiella arboris]
MKTRYVYLLRFVLAVTDILLVNICFVITYYVVSSYDSPLDPVLYRRYLAVANLLWLFSSSTFGLYKEQTIQKLEKIYRSTFRSIVLHGFVFLIYQLLSNDTQISTLFLVIFYHIMGGGFLLSRFIGTVFEQVLIDRYKIRKPVAIMDATGAGIRLAEYLRDDKNFNFHGFLGDSTSVHTDASGEVLSTISDQLRYAAEQGVKEIYVPLTPDRMHEAPKLLGEAEKQCVRLKFVPDLSGTLSLPFSLNYMDTFPVISVRREPLEYMHNRFKKRLFDIVFSLAVILFILSWLYPVIALFIKWQSPGPVLFKQLRSGRDNKPFWCYKFRSMKVNKDSDKKQASVNDDRVTAIGKIMRKTSLDELPQFFNVLMGNMSIVGPRPHMLLHTKEYSEVIKEYMVRQFLKPGITGWAQVNGYRGETKERYQMQKRVEHDIWYMESWSSMLDVQIIFMTIINVFKGEENAF